MADFSQISRKNRVNNFLVDIFSKLSLKIGPKTYALI